MSKLLGFAGIESYDLMHYLGRTITRLGAIVLLVDNSDDKSLAYSIPNFDEFSKLGILNYGNVDVVTNVGADAIADAKYDYVLVYFGFNFKDSLFQACDEIYFVTDLQLHNVFRLSRAELSADAFAFLLIRDRYSSKMSPDLVIEELQKFSLEKENVIYVDDSPEDVNSRILCQYNSRFSFKKVSKSIMDFIVKVLIIDFSEKEIVSAFKLAARG